MRLPSTTPKKLVRTLKKAGFGEVRQKGSHLFLENDANTIISVPMHNKELKRGTLVGIVKDAGLSIDEFVELL